ncbi:MAG: energy transducer TonB [Sulfuricella sp.]
MKDEVPDAVARFMRVLAASLALHLALVFGVHIKASQPVERARTTMEVRIERAPQAKIKPLLLTASAADTTEKKPQEPKLGEEKPALQPPVPAVPAVPTASAEPAPAILPTLEIPLLEDPAWYPAKQVDVHPTALYPIKPDYPDKAAEQGVEGNVVLLLLIDEAGAVKEATVMEANPEGIFEESALSAFREARFAPAQKNGRAVKSRVLIRVSYELNERKKPVVVQPPLPLTP